MVRTVLKRTAFVVALNVAAILAAVTVLDITATTLDEHVNFLPFVNASGAANVCSNWTPVNDPAFGLGTGDDDDYSAEEGFEVLTFRDRLYVGMEADNSMGARIWRTGAGVAIPQTQSDWEEVIADGEGRPFGVDDTLQVDHIDSIAAFKDTIYASTANRSGSSPGGTLVFRSSTGDAGTWEQVNRAGFGDTNNGNFKDMRTFTVNGTEWLCGGTGNDVDGAEVWCTQDGTTWEKKNAGGFGNPSNSLIASTAVFEGVLYVGVSNTDDAGSVWRTPNLKEWEKVYTAIDHSRVEVAGVLNDELYIAEGAADGRYGLEPPMRVFRSAGGDAGTWQEVGTRIGHDENNARTIVDGATVYNGHLYISTMNNVSGAEVWRTDGTTWTHVTAGNEGFGDTDTFAAELIPFNGYLYAWTSNYAQGQRVRRTKCPYQRTVEITKTNESYALDAPLYATLNFSDRGNVNTVTVSAYPDAWATEPDSTRPVKRHYELHADGDTFTATITLGYTDAELVAAGGSESNVYLARWTGDTWEPCPQNKRSLSLDDNEASCAGVTEFSTWALVTEEPAPTAVTMRRLYAQQTVQRGIGLEVLALGTILSVLLAGLLPFASTH